MSSKARTNKQTAGYERLVAAGLGVLAIGTYVFHAYSFDAKVTTQRETALFSALEFLLTLGFGWFSTRAVSRAEFERSLKQFAIGAYRRIRDIESMVDRLKERLQAQELRTGEQAVQNQEVVRAVLEDTLLVVRSSTSDWADVIGDELLALQTIDSLRREKTELQDLPVLAESVRHTDAKIEDINARIQELTKRLPADLQLASRQKEQDDQARDHQVKWMKQQHKENNGLRLKVVAGGQYRCEGDVKALSEGVELVVSVEPEGVEIRDLSRVILGRVLNNTPLAYDDFMRTLAETFGERSIRAQFVKHVAERDGKFGYLYWYEVRVAADPVAVRQPMQIVRRRPTRARLEQEGQSEV